MNITSVASAFPAHYYTQQALLDELKRFWGPLLENPRLLERLHANVAVDGRYLAMEKERYHDLRNWGEANNIWIDVAQDLGQKALCFALNRAGLAPADLGALFFVSVTGISSPSIDARLINRMGLSPNIRRVPIFGLGCVAGAAGISLASDFVKAHPDKAAALLSVELCSLTLQRDDLSVANLLSACLFGDGAAAVIVSGSERNAPGPQVLATRSVFYPGTEHVMGWDVSEKGFKIVLSKEVPRMARRLAADIDDFLSENGLQRSDIGSWLLHTGGPKILEATEEALELPAGALQASWDCLRKTGNLSSASVLCVLEEVMLRRRLPQGTYALLAAMGPGFCSELVLLRF